MAEEAELIGGRMAERRNELGFKQREVADRIPGNTEGKDISRWENGHHRPQSDTLSHIAEALETTVADLLSGPVADRPEKGSTPDVLGALSSESEQLARIEDRQAELLAGVANLDARLDEVLELLRPQRQSRRRGASGE